MNEVTKIHLGRQPFTISVEAHHVLKNYLEAIERQVEDKDVLEEVELRIAELLSEHGISGDKVILLKDVGLVREQLGNPQDFKEDTDATSTASGSTENKRLFRDTDSAMIAGVAGGLAAYLGLDVTLIRIVFVLGTIAWGGGILIYIVLWLLVPEAKTNSDRLQMAGKSVTVGSLKEVVERADVKSAARRANKTLAGPINTAFRIILKFIGIGFIFAGLSGLFGLIASASYVALNNNQILKYNIFPLGLREHMLLYIIMAVASIIALFIVLFGLAVYRRSWPIRTWITGMLIGLSLLGVATGGALAADVYPTVRDRYNANTHLTTRPLKPFTLVNASGDGLDINYQASDRYYVSLNYYGNPNLAMIKTNVVNGTLEIDSSQFDWHRNCRTICIPDTYHMVVTVYSPVIPQPITQYDYLPPEPPKPIAPNQP